MNRCGRLECCNTRAGLASRAKETRMHKVEPFIAPASAACHAHDPSYGRQRLEAALSEGAGAPPAASASRPLMPLTDGNAEFGGPASAQLIGEAGANLVLSRLQSCGIAAQSAMPSLPYDIIADVPHFDLLRIQVKTRSRPTGRICQFRMQRGFYRSKSGVFSYADDDFDIAAFVCLSLNAVFFRAFPIKRFSVPTSLLRLPEIDCETLELAIETIKRRRLQDRLACLAALPSDDAMITASPSSARSSAANATCQQAEFDFEFRS